MVLEHRLLPRDPLGDANPDWERAATGMLLAARPADPGSVGALLTD